MTYITYKMGYIYSIYTAVDIQASVLYSSNYSQWLATFIFWPKQFETNLNLWQPFCVSVFRTQELNYSCQKTIYSKLSKLWQKCLLNVGGIIWWTKKIEKNCQQKAHIWKIFIKNSPLPKNVFSKLALLHMYAHLNKIKWVNF